MTVSISQHKLPRIYTYKITFEEVPYYYYGVHKEKRFDEYYMGTPYTHKGCWKLYTPKKQILEVFNYTDEGYLKAQDIEKSIIKEFMNNDPWCLNANCGGIISVKQLSVGGKNSHKMGVGLHALTLKQRSEAAKKGGMLTAEKLAKVFTLISPTGDVISGRNIKQFCMEYNLDRGHIYKVLNGKRNSHKGYRKFEDESRTLLEVA